jgi:lipoprotein
MKLNTKIKTIFSFSLLSIFVLFLLTGCSDNNSSDTADLKQKVNSEIEYLDAKLIAMMNSLNNIEFTNYTIISEEVTKQDSQTQESSSSSGGQGGSQSGSGEESSDSGNSSGGSSSNGDSSQNTTYKTSKMIAQNPLNRKEQISWDELKNSTSTLYNTWSTIMLDLYQLNVNHDDILNFNKALDALAKYLKDENKVDTAKTLAVLYSYLPKYLETSSEDSYAQNLAYTKSYILNGYAFVEDNNWDGVKNELKKAEDQYVTILNDVNNHSSSEHNINKVYVLLKEKENSLDGKDKDVYYLKYRNLMEELEKLSS